MRIAVLGAGFCGLSVAWHLLAKQSCEVVIYDPKGIGGGASGVATGLMHPYVGEQGRRSVLAQEGMQATNELVAEAEKQLNAPVAIREGIIRYVQSSEQRAMFLSHSEKYGDVTPLKDGNFLIMSGITIDCPRYLEGLWQILSEKGAILAPIEVTDLAMLAEFDQIIIAAGAGVRKFPELSFLPISILKGQVLKCRAPQGMDLLPSSAIGKGYIALTQEPGICLVGSTYEREYANEDPDAQLAKHILFDKIGSFFPSVDCLEAIDCKAALRVTRKGHYFPIVGKVKDNLWIMTSLGSRGLLYHAYLGKLLAEAIINRSNFPLQSLNLQM